MTLRSKISGFTVIHAAAETGQLNKIPKAEINRELLLTRNDNGDTPLHAAAYEGHLDQIPATLITADLLSVKNYEGVSVGRLAIERGFVEQLPVSLQPKRPGVIGKFLQKSGFSRAPFG